MTLCRQSAASATSACGPVHVLYHLLLRCELLLTCSVLQVAAACFYVFKVPHLHVGISSMAAKGVVLAGGTHQAHLATAFDGQLRGTHTQKACSCGACCSNMRLRVRVCVRLQAAVGCWHKRRCLSAGCIEHCWWRVPSAEMQLLASNVKSWCEIPTHTLRTQCSLSRNVCSLHNSRCGSGPAGSSNDGSSSTHV